LIAEPLDKFSARPDRPTSNRVQSKHSHLTPWECPRAMAPSVQQHLGRITQKPDASQAYTQPELADDLLRGADEIAAFIFGTPESRRKVYYLAECCRLPVFRLGSMLCARRSVLLNWIAGQENRVSPPGIAAA
jgi:hypothetical protein